MPGALLVRPQPCQLGVRALADETLVWALARVEAHVVTEGGGLAEAAVAETADEGLVQSVYAHVGAQVTAGVEAAVADDAAHAAGGGKRGGGGGVTQVEIICGEKSTRSAAFKHMLMDCDKDQPEAHPKPWSDWITHHFF